MLVPIQDEYIQKIEQVDDVKMLMKGDKNQIVNKFGTDIAKYKEHLKQVAKK